MTSSARSSWSGHGALGKFAGVLIWAAALFRVRKEMCSLADVLRFWDTVGCSYWPLGRRDNPFPPPCHPSALLVASALERFAARFIGDSSPTV
jgi:hypothetical protein